MQFRRTARNFLRYHHALALETAPPIPFGDVLMQYRSFLAGIQHVISAQAFWDLRKRLFRSFAQRSLPPSTSAIST